MFFYLSFLRPPPLRAPPAGAVLITPQIANDLRTEPAPGAHDIFYAWAQGPAGAAAAPQKLTTWRAAGAYRAIPVPPPPGVRAGQAWRLVLSAQAPAPARGAPHAVALAGRGAGRGVLPVLSMPVLFGPAPARGGGKQERIARVYRFPATGGAGDRAEAVLEVTEQTSFDLDKKIWDSGIGLSSWLLELRAPAGADAPGGAPAARLRDALFAPERRDILELGAGTGLVALVLAALRSALAPPDGPGLDRIIATDLESAMPLLEHNIAANAHACPRARPQAAVLDWDADALPDSVQAVAGGFAAVIMADVTYNTASFPALVRTLARVAALGPAPPLFLLGYKERDPAERTLWDLAREVGIVFEKVGERGGAGGAPVEVWIGTMDR